jgi:hypothetical protein
MAEAPLLRLARLVQEEVQRLAWLQGVWEAVPEEEGDALGE